MSYIQLIIVAFVLNGLCLSTMQAVVELGYGAYKLVFIFLVYLASAAIAFVSVRSEKAPLRQRSVYLGLLGAVGAVAGVYSSMQAIETIPGYIVYPAASGGSLLMVLIFGRLVFKEKISPYGIIGIALGTAAIVLLSMP